MQMEFDQYSLSLYRFRQTYIGLACRGDGGEMAAVQTTSKAKYFPFNTSVKTDKEAAVSLHVGIHSTFHCFYL